MPTALLTSDDTRTPAGLVAAEASLDSEDLATTPVGSGPYILDTAATVTGTSYVYTANPDYWNPDAQHYDELIPIISEAIAQKPTAEWVDILSGMGIPVGPVQDIAEVAADPQIAHRDMFVKLDHPAVGQVPFTGNPIKLSRTPARFDPEELKRLNAKLVHAMDYADVRDRLAGLDADGGEAFWLAVRPNLTVLKDVVEWTRLIEGPYVDYEQVVPRENDKRLTIAIDQLLPAVRRVSILSSSYTHQVRMMLQDGSLELTASSQEIGGEAREVIPGDYSSEALEVAYNAHYFMEILRKIGSDEVIIDLRDSVTAAVVRPGEQLDGEELFYLLMPMRPSA